MQLLSVLSSVETLLMFMLDIRVELDLYYIKLSHMADVHFTVNKLQISLKTDFTNAKFGDLKQHYVSL